MKVIKVSKVVKVIAYNVAHYTGFDQIVIEGEISSLSLRERMVYFTLKDEQAQMSCIMYRSVFDRCRIQPSEGMLVHVQAKPQVYEKQGTLQLSVSSIEPAGIGALYAQLEATKNALAKAGYFRDDHKQAKPDFIHSLGIIAGKDSDALADALKTIQQRWPMLEVCVYPSLVQGSKAPASLIEQLSIADKAGHDAILMIRGGGSFEDLFCFQDEQLVKAIYAAKTYLVTGVGHEMDHPLVELVADYAAKTPTAAAQWVTIDYHEVLVQLQQIQTQLNQRINHLLHQQSQQLNLLARQFEQPSRLTRGHHQYLNQLENQLTILMKQQFHHQQTVHAQLTEQLNVSLVRLSERNHRQLDRLVLPDLAERIRSHRQALNHLDQGLNLALDKHFQSANQQLANQASLLDALSPLQLVAKGYSLTYYQDHLVKRIDQVHENDHINIHLSDGTLTAQVLERKANHE